MFGIAIATGVARGLRALNVAINESYGSRDHLLLLDFFKAWFVGSIDYQDMALAIAGGSIVGLGIPAVLTKPEKSKFLEHPARVLFALFIALIILGVAQNLLAAGIFGPNFHPNPLVCMLGAAATGFVWSLYATVRSRVSPIWRVAILLICLSYAYDFYYGFQLLGVTSFASGRIYTQYSIDLYCTMTILLNGSIALVLVLAGITEIAMGKFKDWRTWTATLVIPICVILIATPMVYELVRSYQLEQTSIRGRTGL